MFILKTTALFLAVYLVSNVLSLDPPGTDDPGLSLMLAVNAVPVRTDFSNPSTFGNSTLGAKDSNVVCIKKEWPDKNRALYSDCAAALRLLPTSSDIQSFCNYGSAPCLFPGKAKSGNCQILANLAHGGPVMSSWAEIGLAATQLIAACLKDGKTAGSTYAGSNRRIKIDITKDR